MGDVSWETDYSQLKIKDVLIVESNISRTFLLDYPQGFRFPQNYVECVLKYQGGKPSKDHLKIPKCGTIVFDCLSTFIVGDISDILEQYHDIRQKLGTNLLFPFAWDKAFNHICFDYRDDRENPQIVYWDRQGLFPKKVASGLFFVCNNFNELQEMLF